MKIERPHRVTHTHRHRIDAPPGEIFPLLCPVREAEWVEGWDPLVVYSDSGVAEPDCVFVMPNEPDDDVWVVTEYEPASWSIGFVKVTPGRVVTRIRMRLEPDDAGGCTAAIAYTFTALGREGRGRIDELTPAAWQEFMESEWERQLGDWLLRRRAAAD